ncbi:MAG: thioredoxin family protein [Deltaproteobacteria bacterium]|nr:thioredoxin family protein [Deltaproteobacteria bacterium]
MSEEDVTQIRLGAFKVGVTGLKGAIAEVQALGLRTDAEIGQALLERLTSRNYIPASARAEHQAAFLREYQKTLGLPVEEGRHAPEIKILGPGCPSCQSLGQMVMEVLTELDLPADVEFIKDINAFAAYGVYLAPAVIINDQVKIMGRVPTREALRQWLAELKS